MSDRAHLLVLVATLAVVVWILRLVRAQHLRSKYALLWLVIAVLLLPLGMFPDLLEPLADAVGVDYAPTAFLLAALGFLFLVVVHLTRELSRLETRSRTLAEELALLRRRVDELDHDDDDDRGGDR